MKTSKQKIDELLGISEGGTIDDFLADISTEADLISATVLTIDDGVLNAVALIDNNLKTLSDGNADSSLTMANIEANLSELNSLIDISKKVILHVYQSVITTDLVDSELIGAMAKLIEATHINIADYISLYKQRVSFYDKIRTMAYALQQKIELMKLKHELDMKKLETKSVDVTPEGMMSFTFEDVSKMVNDADGNLSEIQ